MPVAIVVLIAGVVAALIMAALSGRRGIHADPIDPEAAEHWLLVRIHHHPRLFRVLAIADRRVVGGVTVAISLVAVFAAALAVGWTLDTVDTGQGFARWDQSLAEWGSENATDTSTDLLEVITWGGDWIFVLAALIVVGFVDFRRRRNPNVYLFLAVIGAGTALLNNGLKWLVDRERPPVEHLVGASGSSFPSGHSAAAAAAWAAIALIAGRHVSSRLRPYLAGAAAAITILVAASRVLLGVHWLTDVIAGVIVGWGWFFLVALAFGGRLQRLGEPADRARLQSVGDQIEQ